MYPGNIADIRRIRRASTTALDDFRALNKNSSLQSWSMAMLPETTKDKATSPAARLNVAAHVRDRERIRHELELAKQEARRTLAETRRLLERVEELTSKR